MNRFVIAAVAASTFAAPGFALAQDRPPEGRNDVRVEDQRGSQHGQTQRRTETRRDDHRTQQTQRHVETKKHAAQPREYHAQVAQPRAWHSGDRFDRAYAPHYTRVVHVDHYGLHRPPAGYVWVRSGWDALLVRLSNNIVVSISPGVFH